MVSLDDPNLRQALDAPDGPELPRMSFGDHLDELRSRLIKALLAIVVAIVAILPFKDGVQEIIVDPYRAVWREGFRDHVERLEQRAASAAAEQVPLDEEIQGFLDYCRKNKDRILAGQKETPHLFPLRTGFQMPYTLYATDPLGDVFSWMWASLVFALVMASPVVIWQIWAFLAAGLYPHERAVFYRYFPAMLLLMAAGVLFGYFVVLPYSLRFLMQMMNPTQVSSIFTVGSFLTLEFALTGALGVVFQLPLVMVALQRIGLVTHGWYRKNWRLTVLLIFVAAALVTPPDPVSMLLMAAPMLVLFLLGLVLTAFGRRHEAKVAPV
jgi:sec-independent protein translocase protein TatC